MIIGISQLRVICIIGCTPDERRDPQTIFVDLRMTVKDPVEDRLDNTVDYVLVSQAIEKTLMDGKFQLLETASQSILKSLFAQFSQFSRIWIRIEKPSALASAKCSYVEYERSRV